MYDHLPSWHEEKDAGKLKSMRRGHEVQFPYPKASMIHFPSTAVHTFVPMQSKPPALPKCLLSVVAPTAAAENGQLQYNGSKAAACTKYVRIM
jgi:hypothetical protein